MIKFPGNAKRHTYGVFCNSGPFTYYKTQNTCGGTLILVKIAGYSEASLKLTLLQK